MKLIYKGLMVLVVLLTLCAVYGVFSVSAWYVIWVTVGIFLIFGFRQMVKDEDEEEEESFSNSDYD